MGALFNLSVGSALTARANGARPDAVAVSNDQFPVYKFDATTDQSIMWSEQLLRAPSGTVTCVLKGMMASATANSIQVQVQIGAYTPGDSTDLDTTFSLDTANSAGATVPGTAGYPFEVRITLTNVDSWADEDQVLIRLNRDADGTSGTDNATGDWYFTGGFIEDAA